MATVNIDTGPMVDDLGLIVNVQSAKPPFNLPVGIHAKTYIEGTDFADGDTVNIFVKNCPGIKFASVTDVKGAVITIAIAADADTFGYKITFTATAEDKQVLIFFTI